MTTKKVKYMRYLDPSQIDELHEIHERTKIPAAVIAREGIDLILKKYRERLLQIMAHGEN